MEKSLGPSSSAKIVKWKSHCMLQGTVKLGVIKRDISITPPFYSPDWNVQKSDAPCRTAIGDPKTIQKVTIRSAGPQL